jgi:tRNA(Arg) A34 adenosine deaminase TadA
MTDDDLRHLEHCAALAAEALDAGDAPFGSVLVGGDGTGLREDRNRDATGPPTSHPELMLAPWAGEHLPPPERTHATGSTSGEHCAMCSAAHAWAGIGRIVYAVSTGQLLAWREEFGAAGTPVVAPLPVQAVAPGVVVDGPAPQLADTMRELHRRHAAADG